MENKKDKGIGGQQSNQNWDEQNDKEKSSTHEPNPERSGKGSAFNEGDTATGYGSSQRNKEQNVGPLDADLDSLPGENSNRKDLGSGEASPA